MNDQPLESKVIKLWRDNSKSALELEAKLKEAGYKVNAILSGSDRPIASYPGQFVSGYANIRMIFGL